MLNGQSNSAATAQAEENEVSPAGKFVQEPTYVQEPIEPKRQATIWERKRPSLSYNKRLSPLVLSSVSDAMGTSWKSTVRVVHQEQQVALGTVVNSDGWIITKASQLPDSKAITCKFFDFRSLPATVVSRVPDLDLALLRVDARDLVEPDWASNPPSAGKFVATADVKNTPTSFGVVSAGIQRIPYKKSVLGVFLADNPKGAEVTKVLLGSGGERAGLKVADKIYEANGLAVNSLGTFKKAIRNASGGDFIKLKVRRNKESFAVSAQLMDLADELLHDTEMEVNGDVSARASNFERVLPHDSILRPNQCGGPLVDLDGKVVGINIARAGRVTSYALPSDVVLPAITELLQDAKLVSRKAENPSSGEPVR